MQLAKTWWLIISWSVLNLLHNQLEGHIPAESNSTHLIKAHLKETWVYVDFHCQKDAIVARHHQYCCHQTLIKEIAQHCLEMDLDGKLWQWALDVGLYLESQRDKYLHGLWGWLKVNGVWREEEQKRILADKVQEETKKKLHSVN